MADITVIMPAFNEQECIESVVRELTEVLRNTGREFEIIIVNDGSTDSTPAILKKLKDSIKQMTVLTLIPRSGQSAAFGAGIKAAHGKAIVLMDADGQNDPADIPALLSGLELFDVCCGWRKNRQDTFSKRYGSRLANRIRNWILDDGIIDTGCSLKAFKSNFLKDLPMNLRGMHRFLPALARMRGAKITQIPVNHRQRQAGSSKYTNFGRLMVTISDLKAVRWMQKRHCSYQVEEMK